MNWHVLDVGSIWVKEFASALSRIRPVVGWQPRMLATGMFQDWEHTFRLVDPPLEVIEFPLQRGYARAPLRRIAPYERTLLARLLKHESSPEKSPLICTTPFYAPVAELWPGPVVYYATDLTFAYEGLNPAQVTRMERRMCRCARLVCPNSRRIAEHLEQAAGCDAGKITVIPNATRSSNIAGEPRYEPGPPPEDVAGLPRPLVGVLGDLSGNMDWELIAEAIRRTPGFSWVFVGPTSRPIADVKQRAAAAWVKRKACFVGAKPYGELQTYARCLDVAVLPYRKKEPTYSGSSTRFYEHLAALRPMLATRGFAELLEKEPLLELIDTPVELAEGLLRLREQGFRDGHEERRWESSRDGTWDQRAEQLTRAFAEISA